jgi:hypothetical protein
MVSVDHSLKDCMNKHIEEWLNSIAEANQIPNIRARLSNREWKTEAVPA